MGILFISLLFLVLVPSAFAQVQISEVYPVPPSGQFEWIELHNISEDSVSVGSYKLVDNANHTIKLPQLVALPNMYIIATASGILNNSGDSVTLLSPSGVTIDTMTYEVILIPSQSLALCGTEWVIADITTPGFANSACIADPTIKPTVVPTQEIYTPSPSATQTPVITISQAASMPDVLGIAISPQSFSRKHKPSFSSPQPTITTTTAIPTAYPPPEDIPTPLGVYLALILMVCAGAFCMYLIIKKRKISIMNIHEEEITLE
ncbi:hypothetical protein A3B02_00395 [Candidatus Roizmanbacteria bacterium RIFCSPLOWO2_01_FULL_42_14]|nr:MAG: hypothetical protein A3F32_01125 [Candidatus Roizmanbacteria bacterium RIFCSPHIGHO2_12_FULL_42_10]OGK52714.1 MAG: hypothetical protein A3B02_00395 [Candidatus Roizmanbacteria bacterium RIFCSPLOWO2_01_FULL_42_14]OGK61181.1 MAG: hypothetical protein A3I56_03755 [Candidatus Roizmanbacteria bacterium RIFCSPLOWO2_02_FULL_43_10]